MFCTVASPTILNKLQSTVLLEPLLESNRQRQPLIGRKAIKKNYHLEDKHLYCGDKKKGPWVARLQLPLCYILWERLKLETTNEKALNGGSNKLENYSILLKFKTLAAFHSVPIIIILPSIPWRPQEKMLLTPIVSSSYPWPPSFSSLFLKPT